MVYRIITYKDKESDVLFQPPKKIDDFGKSFQSLVKDMKETFLSSEEALGLAANQLNLDKAVCIVKLKKGVEIFCNPEIVSLSKEKETMEEGCLSFPNIFLMVPRAKEISVVYQDIKGKKKKINASGLEARVLQHEIDHLNGIAFLERGK